MTPLLTWAVAVVLAVLAAVAGVLVFRLGSMARVTYALLAVFLLVGAELVLLGLHYLGVVVVLMMTIEMVIMAVFMIAYMMDPAGLMPMGMSMAHNRRTALVVSVGAFVLLATGVVVVDWPAPRAAPPADPTFQVGESLMRGQMLTMVTLGFVLFATMVAATVLAARRGRYDRFGDDLDRREPEDPVRGGVGR
ncbi:NADH-quinone oxidoreductase subunit J [Plantactinospora sp. WMMC1484]|uniref:NADH-quinone oxidoreductase subunit J n=1 Tax=Plantactinospora sp. WMMC1484 TaxID=3404122 RepID=UPI003BF54782